MLKSGLYSPVRKIRKLLHIFPDSAQKCEFSPIFVDNPYEGKIFLMKYSQPDKTNMLERVQLLRFHVKMFCLVLRSYGFLRASDIVFSINFNLSSGEHFLMCSESIRRKSFNAHLLSARGLQRDVVCLDRPIPPSYVSPKCGDGGGGVACGVSANEYSCAHGSQINFGELTPYLTYGQCWMKNEFWGTLRECWRNFCECSFITKIWRTKRKRKGWRKVQGGNTWIIWTIVACLLLRPPACVKVFYDMSIDPKDTLTRHY